MTCAIGLALAVRASRCAWGIALRGALENVPVSVQAARVSKAASGAKRLIITHEVRRFLPAPSCEKLKSSSTRPCLVYGETTRTPRVK